MAKNARRKESGAISRLLLELSALASILGISQPMLRDTLWSLISHPSAANSTQRTTSDAQQFAPYVPQQSFTPEPTLPAYPSAYTAQVILPQSPTHRSNWNGASYRPMGGYQ